MNFRSILDRFFVDFGGQDGSKIDENASKIDAQRMTNKKNFQKQRNKNEKTLGSKTQAVPICIFIRLFFLKLQLGTLQIQCVGLGILCQMHIGVFEGEHGFVFILGVNMALCWRQHGSMLAQKNRLRASWAELWPCWRRPGGVLGRLGSVLGGPGSASSVLERLGGSLDAAGASPGSSPEGRCPKPRPA